MTDTDCVQRVMSRSVPGSLLHVVVDAARVSDGRVNLSPESERLQLSVINLAVGAQMVPHTHNQRAASTELEPHAAQEAWIVVQGALRVRLYDEDRSLLRETVLGPGSILLTLRGGHSFEAVVDGTVFVECKNGPYLGRDYTAISEAE